MRGKGWVKFDEENGEDENRISQQINNQSPGSLEVIYLWKNLFKESRKIFSRQKDSHAWFTIHHGYMESQPEPESSGVLSCLDIRNGKNDEMNVYDMYDRYVQ